jgi:hypothetical protein
LLQLLQLLDDVVGVNLLPVTAPSSAPLLRCNGRNLWQIWRCADASFEALE